MTLIILQSIGEWSDYVASMGVSEYNTFMYNKVQLYVPDLSAHYASVVGDKINSVLRLSKRYIICFLLQDYLFIEQVPIGYVTLSVDSPLTFSHPPCYI